jgi:hypothetical protein
MLLDDILGALVASLRTAWDALELMILTIGKVVWNARKVGTSRLEKSDKRQCLSHDSVDQCNDQRWEKWR